MTWKRLLLAAAAAAAGVWAHPAGAETVTPTLTQDQANRLSLFHDYGLTSIGTDNYVGSPANVGNPNDAGAGPVPGVAGGGLMRSLLGPYASDDPTGPGRAFDVTATPVLGYDANPESRRVGRGSVFTGGDLGIAYHVADGANDPIAGRPLRATFAYDILGAVYEGQAQNADTLQQNAFASVRQTLFNNTVVLNASIGDTFTTEHGVAFLNTADAGATAELFFAPQVSVEAGYNFTKLIYFYRAILPAQKADAERNTFVGKIHLYTLPQRRGAVVDEAPDVLTEILRGALRRFTVNYAYIWNVPDRRRNRDYKWQGNRIGFGLEGLTVPPQFGQWGRNVTVDVDYTREFEGYAFSNSNQQVVLAGHLTPRGGPHRKDGIDVFTVRGNARLFDLPHDAGTLSAYLQWDLIHDGSTIVTRRYNDYVIGGGVTYRY